MNPEVTDGSGQARGVRQWFAGNRARIARVVLIAGLVGLFFELAPLVPRDTQLDFRLGDAHAEVVALQVELLRGEDTLRTVELRYAQGAPLAVLHETRLPAGDVDLHAQLILRDGRIVHLERSFQIPAEAAVRIDLAH